MHILYRKHSTSKKKDVLAWESSQSQGKQSRREAQSAKYTKLAEGAFGLELLRAFLYFY